jgi:hypothetical protein
MRLWSFHPKYLDSKGLVALWRESLLAQKVIQGKTKGYKNHPQLKRFKKYEDSIKAIGCYLSYVYEEGKKRGYNFNKEKIKNYNSCKEIIEVNSKQLEYEFEHLKNKLRIRDTKLYKRLLEVQKDIEINPVFRLVEGEIEEWEKISKTEN